MKFLDFGFSFNTGLQGLKMHFSRNFLKSGFILVIVLLVSACVAKEDLILPSTEQRITAVDTYKQCVSYATNKRLNQNMDAEAIVRDSIEHCRSSKYAMLKDYPKNWRASFEKQIDEDLLKTEMAYVKKARGN